MTTTYKNDGYGSHWYTIEALVYSIGGSICWIIPKLWEGDCMPWTTITMIFDVLIMRPCIEFIGNLQQMVLVVEGRDYVGSLSKGY